MGEYMIANFYVNGSISCVRMLSPSEIFRSKVVLQTVTFFRQQIDDNTGRVIMLLFQHQELVY